MNRLLIVGDALLDRDLDGAVSRLAPDAPVPVVEEPREWCRPGGAALAAALAAGDGREVTLITALGADDAGATVRTLLERIGVNLVDVGNDGPTPQKVRVRASGQPVVRLDYGERRGTIATPDPHALSAVRSARAVLVSDYGRGISAEPAMRDALEEGAEDGAKLVWDPHPRGAAAVPGARAITPNLAEARHVTRAGDTADDVRTVTRMATDLRTQWQAHGVAVTLGSRGALLVSGDGTPLMVPAPVLAQVTDPCGAGDRFAVTVAGSLADGAVLSEAIVAAVASASEFVAAGGAGAVGAQDAQDSDATRALPEDHATAHDIIAAVHQRGGRVVATGGCFDLLHAGHVQLLADARRLGDCLVVCINSDDSVRRLKGPGRPVVREADRSAVLLGLEAVDAVITFDEDTPERVLSELRPDIWVKGADYAVTDLPEAPLIASWGGHAVVLPYLAGRSTTSMIQEALRHARH